MIYIYSALLYLISPFILVYLKKRSLKNKEYANFWHERFAIGIKNPQNKPIIWLHSVSVGETRAMTKLVEILTKDYPQYQILITITTPTGRHTAKFLYPQAIVHYVPYDLTYSVDQFYSTFKPVVGLIMETEIWPNLVRLSKKYKVPLFLVNARLSDKSFRRYVKFRWFISPIIVNFEGIFCQNIQTRERFAKLGYSGNLKELGNTKFDLNLDLNRSVLEDLVGKDNKRKIISIISTRDGEEKQLINQIKLQLDRLYIIIPRHPERFAKVEELLINKGINYQKRSDNKQVLPTTQILLGDSMGEIPQYLKITDLVLMGGSFESFGGHNLIEPVYFEVPVIVGPYVYNFEKIVSDMLEEHCIIQVRNMQEAILEVEQILQNQDKYRELVNNCKGFVQKYTGASQRVIEQISRYLV